MAALKVRLNLASAIFPFYTEAAGRTIMMPDQDENFDRYNAANTTPDKGVPQVFYMHNCLPIAGGFQSIGYNQSLAGMAGKTDFDTAFNLYNPNQSSFIFVPAQGMNYIYDASYGTGEWSSVNPIPSGTLPANALVTTAYVDGNTYIYYAKYGCFTYDPATRQLVAVVLSGLTAANVIGICAANGYMVAWTQDTVAWSSLSDPTDFVPSIQTGAGGGSIQDAKGQINFCVSIVGGFLICCQKNVVGASYTNNSSWPYQISEVSGSGGIATIEQLAYQTNLSYMVAMTTAGIQQVSLSGAIPTMPEVSDFITARLFEDFDEVGLTFSAQYLESQVDTKFAAVGDRFIVISYGIQAPNFTHAIIYDIELNRYGKLKLPHRCAFSYNEPAAYGMTTYDQLMNTPISVLGNITYANFFFGGGQPEIIPKENLAFLQQDGTIQLVDFSLGEERASGVFILGKLQFRRGDVIVHQWTDVESIKTTSVFNFYLLPTFNGKDFTTAVATTAIKPGILIRRMAKKYTASNLSLCLTGAFNLTTIVINFTVGGSR